MRGPSPRPEVLATAMAALLCLAGTRQLDADLIALYRFDEASGDSAADTITSNDALWFPGSLSVPDWRPSSGLINGAARLPGEGTHQNYFTIAGFPEIDGTPAGMTISIWFKPDGSSGYRGIVMTRGVNGTDNYGIGHETDHLDGRVDGRSIDSLSGSLTATGEWFHLAWVWDNIARTQRLYINGAPAGSPVSVDPQTITSNFDWRVGDDACCNSRNLDGLVDDLSVWDEPLTTAEIASLYTNGLAGFSANTIPPRPVTEPLDVGLVINEIHYDPDPKTEFTEFIEILNTGPDPIDLSGYQFTEGVDFTFPPGTILGVTEYLILGEDPTFLASAYPELPQTFQYLGSLGNDGETLVLRDASTAVVDSIDYRAEFPWPVTPHGGGHSMQLVNATLDNDLAGSWRPALPTPGFQNSTFTGNAPPQMRQVDHLPQQPTSAEDTTVSIKATDPDGVATMTLHYQLNAPGQFIPAFLPLPSATVNSYPGTPLPANPAFENPANWTSVPMTALPLDPDRYSATIPAQAHRTLIRYRITATDTLGNSIRAPFPDDPSLNFACFSYDGVPDYSADTDSVHPGGPGHNYPSDLLTSLPVYHLITDPDDFGQCWAYDSSDRISTAAAPRSKFNWEGAMVYDNKVYDHVSYRLRQKNDRYAGGVGRRSMRFRFRRGNYLQAHDPTGKKYPEKWRSLNTSKMSRFTEGANHGMRELISSRLWNLAGVVAPDFQHVHFRVIDAAAEAPDQYHGDFYGLAMIFEDVDTQFIKSRDLPRGNIYKLKDGESSPLELQKYQARNSVGDGSDFINIRDNLGPPTQSDQWLREHVDWDSWYLYSALGEGFRHYDFAPYHQKNRIWHFKPDPVNPLGLMYIIPHDTDATWKRGTNDAQWFDPSYGPGDDYRGRVVGIDLPKEAIQEITGLDGSDGENHPERDAFMLEYRNVIREVRDILWQPETVNTVIDLAAANIAAFSLADRDRWDKGPDDAGNENIGPLEDQVATMRSLAFTEDLYMGSSLAGGRAQWLSNLAIDSAIPDTPVITYAGPPEHSSGQLVFASSAFSDPQGAGSFGAIEWRIAEAETPVVPVLPLGSTWKYLDDGSDQGSAWQDPAFDDSPWPSGPAQLGYGEGDEATVLNYGPDPDAKFPTTYFRKTFNLIDAASLGDLRLSVIRDDGVIVWLNGERVFSNNMPASGVDHLTFASDNAGDDGKTPQTIILPNFFFLEGPNTLAVEIHQRTASSSDISFDLSLEQAAAAEPLHEWNATWESGELNSFQSTTTVPALATREGHSYRARVRHRDNGGRWSHWSAPYQFVAGAADTSIYQESLVVSEVMYHPATPTPAEILAGYDDDDFFEFVEIRNVGDQTLDLTDIRFTKGINFNFFNSAITSLAPGDFALVVNHLAAFEMRHGTGLPVAGEYTGSKFDNGGETVKLSFGAGTALREFTYDDVAPWPLTPDGTGPSLVLNAPWALPDHADPANWRASSYPDGSPGELDPTTFTGDPDADLDGDGLNALVEYALGSSDNLFTGPPLELSFLPNGDLSITFTQNLLASDLDSGLQVSDDLATWLPAGPEFVTQTTEHLDGTGTTTMTLPAPLPSDRLFLRFAAALAP